MIIGIGSTVLVGGLGFVADLTGFSNLLSKNLGESKLFPGISLLSQLTHLSGMCIAIFE